MYNLKYSDYYDKTYATWLGKCIGGNMGCYLECYRQIFNFTCPDEFAPKEMFPNDDLDIQLVWLDVLLQKGVNFNQDDLMEAFIDCYRFNFSEYGYGKRNFRRGIKPPYSGCYNNDFNECLGSPIRSEIWGLIAPGNPKLASEYAYLDSTIDHSNESAYAEMYLSAIIAEGFTCSDLKHTLQYCLSFISSDSRVYFCVKDAIGYYENGVCWDNAIKQIHNDYGHSDATYSVYNIGVVILGLLYGGGDFDKTLTTTINGGYDTDCTCATAGAIFAMFYGKDSIPEKWVTLAEQEIKTACTNLKTEFKDFDILTHCTCQVGLHFNEQGANQNIVFEECVPNSVELPIKKTSEIDIRIDYIDPPELRLSQKSRANITIKNNSPKHFDFEVMLQKSEMIKCNSISRVAITPHNEEVLEYEFFLEDNILFIEDSNIITLELFDRKSEVDLKFDFGFAGSQFYKISDIYYDSFDYVKIGDLNNLPETAFRTYGPHKVIFHTDVVEYDNGWVRVDHEYLDEKKISEDFDDYFEQGRSFSTVNDSIEINRIYGYNGPCLVYAFQKFSIDTPREVEFHIGSSDPYKMWLNGELISEQKENQNFCIYNHKVRADLSDGINKLVVKVVRKSKHNRFAYVLRDTPFLHLGPIITDIKYHK